MKIAHVVCSFPPYYGGMGNSALQMALATAKYNHQVAVITPNYGSKRLQNLDSFPDLNKLKVIRLRPCLSYGNAAWMPQITAYLLAYDVVHLHYPFYGSVFGVLFAKLLKPSLKLVIHYHMDTQASGLKGFIFRWYRFLVFPIIATFTDSVTCASLDYVKHSQIANYALAKPTKFMQIPFGVDLNRFTSVNQPSAFRKLLFVGGLDEAHYFKGVGILLEAMKLTREVNENWELQIVGRGNLKAHYVKQAERLGLSDKVTFIDDADDDALVSLYQNSRCLILPSINSNEAFGLVLLEAMACGRPVIASNLPGVRNVFRHKKEGLVVQANNVHDLSDKILRILNDDQLVDKCGASARDYCEQYYNWSHVGKLLNELYHRVKYSPKI